MTRLKAPHDPVTMHFDGEVVVAERGESAAAALVAAGHLALARSPKFHRPRGPACFRAACDGCLARVDGVPNVMTCRVAAREGMRIETQNVVGSRDIDLLRVADWFFPQGMNHHELLAGVPGLQRVMQAFARRVAGLGKLPDGTAAPAAAGREAARREVDVLIVGAGPSGMAAALEMARRGRRVEVLDDDLDWGGSVRALPGPAAAPWAALVDAFAAAVASPGASAPGIPTRPIRVRTETTAAAVYGGDVLVVDERGIEVVTARTLVLAPGAHDGGAAFEGNDVPGVMSARAAGRLLARGVVVGERVVVALLDGGGPFGEAFARSVAGTVVVRAAPVRVRGSARVKEVAFAAPKGERVLECDALLIDAPRAPAHELCAQAGATLTHEERGYVAAREGGAGVLVVGEAAGTPFEPGAVLREAASLQA
jgi:sarcosine oxidase subunit alpha